MTMYDDVRRCKTKLVIHLDDNIILSKFVYFVNSIQMNNMV